MVATAMAEVIGMNIGSSGVSTSGRHDESEVEFKAEVEFG